MAYHVEPDEDIELKRGHSFKEERWEKLVKRMQHASRQGKCVLTITVVVDDYGIPAHWLSPRVQNIEPNSAPIESLLLTGQPLLAAQYYYSQQEDNGDVL